MISRTAGYALRAVLYIAQNEGEGPVRVNDMAPAGERVITVISRGDSVSTVSKASRVPADALASPTSPAPRNSTLRLCVPGSTLSSGLT